MSTPNHDWPPKSGLSTHIVPRASTILQISSSTTIAAPGSLIFAVLREAAAYPSWNTWCPTLTINTQPPETLEASKKLLNVASVFTLRVVMDDQKPDKMTDAMQKVTDISTPSAPSGYITDYESNNDGSFEPDLSRTWRIAWSSVGRFVARGLKTERINETVELGDGRCEYKTWECQGGILARMVRWFYGELLNEKFGVWCEDLRRECERRAKEEEGKGLETDVEA